MEGGLLLDVVVGQSPSVLQLLPCKDQPLLVRRNALLVLDLGLHILDGVGRLDLKSDGLARQGLHEDLHLRAGDFSCRSDSFDIMCL